MTDLKELELALPDGSSVDLFKEQMRQRYALAEEPEHTFERVYYDSFDWRLHLAGGILFTDPAQERETLQWRDRESARVLETTAVEHAPRLIDDLAPSAFRDRLAPILEMRALLPMAKVEVGIQILRLLDSQDKTVLRLALERYDVKDPDGAHAGRLHDRVRLVPVRGYDKPLESMQRFLGEDLGLQSVQGGVLMEALQTLGRQPGDYTSKLNFSLDPFMRSDAVAKQIHLHLLQVIEANVEGTIADLDSEFLHDLRVATRRARSALTQIKGVFPAVDVEQFKERLAWIGGITGPTRDMDVYLLGFEAYRDSLPESVRGDLAPLKAFLLNHHQSEQSILAEHLRSDRFRSLLAEWRAFLEAPLLADPEPPNALRPITDLANERIHKMYRRVLKEGRAIDDSSPHEAYHELRKSCKKLRYLMEFFQSLYPAKPIRGLIKELKVLLDNLGEFQDLEVQADKLRQFGRQMLEEASVPADTLLTMGMLVDRLLTRQQQTKRAFAKLFDSFANADNRRCFKQLFSHG